MTGQGTRERSRRAHLDAFPKGTPLARRLRKGAKHYLALHFRRAQDLVAQWEKEREGVTTQ